MPVHAESGLQNRSFQDMHKITYNGDLYHLAHAIPAFVPFIREGICISDSVLIESYCIIYQ